MYLKVINCYTMQAGGKPCIMRGKKLSNGRHLLLYLHMK